MFKLMPVATDAVQGNRNFRVRACHGVAMHPGIGSACRSNGRLRLCYGMIEISPTAMPASTTPPRTLSGGSSLTRGAGRPAW